MRPSIPSVIPAIAKMARAHPKDLLMMRMTKSGIRRILRRVRILGRLIFEIISSE
jgi:hypothetical protein